jgi:hypothetical protein
VKWMDCGRSRSEGRRFFNLNQIDPLNNGSVARQLQPGSNGRSGVVDQTLESYDF